MDIGKIIKERRTYLKLSQQELADKVGVSKSLISRYESGEIDNMGINRLSSLAKTLEIDPMILLNGADALDEIPNITPLNKVRRIPIIGEIACGDPVFADENYSGYFIADDLIKADFCLKTFGDSMVDAGIHDGDLAFLRKQSEVENGEIAAVYYNGEATLKRVYRDEDKYILQPCNNRYKPIVIKDDIQVLGKLVGVYHFHK